MGKYMIVKGTLILTLAGLATRLIGFFYKIFLSNSMGTEKLGLYQLIIPIYSICFTLYASGIQTAISKLVAEEISHSGKKGALKILRQGMALSLVIAGSLSLLVYLNSDWIALRILSEPECASPLRILSFVFPFCGMTACVNGYYYGLKKAGVPAVTQLVEQIIRVGFVYIMAVKGSDGGIAVTCELAVVALVLGEIASDVYNIASLFFGKKGNSLTRTASSKRLFQKLVTITVPLTSNRLLLSVLHSFEVILIPILLKKNGMEGAAALSLFGILNGMALPFLFFPSSLTNSLSVLLLPEISEAAAKQNTQKINQTITLSVKFSLLLGIISSGVFMFFGNALGNLVFHEPLAGHYLAALAWLCPFLYLTTTLGSIINGLGKTHLTFINSSITSAIRLLLLAVTIPYFGIEGYIYAMLASQVLVIILDFLAIRRNAPFCFDGVNSLLKPVLITLACGFFTSQVYHLLASEITFGKLPLLLFACAIFCSAYVILLFVTKAVTRKEWNTKGS